jgi:hypothetical protein
MRLKRRVTTRLLEVALVILALLAVSEYAQLQKQAHAAIDLVTVPYRDSVQLTIYNSADITLAKDRRYLTFKKGLNQIQFSWANTLIDPTSVEFRALKQADKVEVIDTTYPPNRPDTLIWNIESQVEGEVPVEITYFTSGLTWQADYVAIATPDESKIDLSGLVKVVNNSGEDYENAQVRLIVGTIHLVENIADLARRGHRRPPRRYKDGLKRKFREAEKLAAEAAAPERPDEAPLEEAKKIVKEGLSEYFLYTIGGTETVPHRWAKRMPSLNVTKIPVKAIYRYAEHKYGSQVTRFYKFKNRKVEGKKEGENNLGEEPLPNGMVRVFKRDKDGNLTFVGQQHIKYMPIGEDVEVNLGTDSEVLLERKLVDFKKTDIRTERNARGRAYVSGWNTRHSYRTRIRNTKKIPIQFEIERRFGGDWELDAEFHHDKLDKQTVRFVFKLKPGQQIEYSYKLITRYGKNSKR